MNLIGSIFTYIIPSFFGQGLNEAIYILILYSMFNQIPKQLEEAARIDGASKFKTFMNITVPFVSPQLVYLMITSIFTKRLKIRTKHIF